ncbi:class I SAM-dependent methyltransferase [Planctomicrobium piriforme]|uniref:S-adenosylmethionine-diacylgycerolhomoserine-N-methlytransferase n=1 Tax=Planctomicrobium piriforme TaxID=1576369 RepID=A0A1I3DB23_9PLAN|nr:class I SAM-dependent methyltransferase [Planctomicrobium piriforme]SFH83924.1 S-adenosylmethionine-diacylgycerolhomoserine-N-methlytransferase [Planctomicrobium piriforme]
MANVVNDLKTLWHLVARRASGSTHQERLESFYSGQANGYDDFRRRMLHSRQEMIQSVPVPQGGVWVDLGAGTGENAEHLGPRINDLSKMYLVDLSTSLLEQAQARVQARGWQNVVPVCHDATTFVPPEGSVDVVTFSYSLTMIPDWFRAMDHAYSLLKPGGSIGIVDFFVARKYPGDGHTPHGWSTRTFWPPWFGSDNVFLSPDHIPYLKNKFETVMLSERRGKIPYLPFVRAPHYVFIGKKRAE